MVVGSTLLAAAHNNTRGTASNLFCLFTDSNDFLPWIPGLCLVWSSAAKHTGCTQRTGQNEGARCSVNAQCLNKGPTEANVNFSSPTVLEGAVLVSGRRGRGWSTDCSPGFQAEFGTGQAAIYKPSGRPAFVKFTF